MHGPISGIMLKMPAIIPTSSQNGRSMMARPIDTIVADDERDDQLAPEEPADGAVEPPGDDQDLELGARRDQRLGHPSQVGDVHQQVEGDDRGQDEDQGDVEDPEPDLPHRVELLLEGLDRSLPNCSSRSSTVGIRIGQSSSSDRSARSSILFSTSARSSGHCSARSSAWRWASGKIEEAGEHGDADDGEVGEPGAERPGDVPALQPVTTGLRMNTIAPARTSGGKIDPEVPGHDPRAARASRRGRRPPTPPPRPAGCARRLRVAGQGRDPWAGPFELAGDLQQEVLSPELGHQLHADRQPVVVDVQAAGRWPAAPSR